MSKVPQFLVDFPAVERPSTEWRQSIGGDKAAVSREGPAAEATGGTTAPASVAGSVATAVSSSTLWSTGAGIDWSALIATLPLDRSVAEVAWATAGYNAGMAALASFMQPERIASYATSRNDPTLRASSGLSPWLHAGHIAPARVALEAYRLRRAPATPAKVTAGLDSFIEELIVRRELADNYCHYNARYESTSVIFSFL